jgi:histidinol phosphatase-like enzyme (inositol monophosphatase family)
MSFPRYSAPARRAELSEFVPFVHELIAAAFATIRPYFLSGTAVDIKHDASPVTQADRGAERVMRALIERRYPAHGIVGEEFGEKRGEQRGDQRYRWVLDPVDGTRAFITHCFLFGTLIALERWEPADGQRDAGFRPLLGAIAHPAVGVALIGHRDDTRLYAADGTTRRVRVRDCARIEDATVLATTHWSKREQGGGAAIEHVIQRAKLYRTWGDCFGYFALSTGGADVMLDPTLSYWDVAAIVPVVEGAGGRVTSWTGGNPLAELSVIATAGTVHDDVVRTLHVAGGPAPDSAAR